MNYRYGIYMQVKEYLWDGMSARQIRDALGISVNSVYNVRSGRAGNDVPWPDGTTGPMPEHRVFEIAVGKGGKMRGISKDKMERCQGAHDIREVVERHQMEGHIYGSGKTGDVIVELDRDECDPQYVEWERKVEDTFRDVEWPHEKRFLGEYPKYEGYALRVGAYAIPDEETPSVEEHVRYCKELLEDWHRFNQ